MNGILRAQNLYNTYVSGLIDSEFSQYADKIAVGICGQGSDCWGYDDSISNDHDNDTELVLWLDDETYEAIGQDLAKAYHGILHVANDNNHCSHNPRKGVRRISDFYSELTGSPTGPQDIWQWMQIPSNYLADATNGQIFRDDLGKFSSIREYILYGMPEEVRLKKIAGRLALAAQSGQYNYKRCIDHGELEAAEIALSQFVEHAIHLIYLLNFQHAPYYKWQFKRLRELRIMPEAVGLLSSISLNTCDREEAIEEFAKIIIKALKEQGLSHSESDYLEHHAIEIQDGLQNPALKTLHIMEI